MSTQLEMALLRVIIL